MVKLNKNTIQDKIHACWIGKNIGGTIGGPYEGRREILDIKGFTTKKGSPLPNDDLDLQLVWLKAMEEYGPYQMSEQVLGEYWLSFISPHWNEYGVAKANLRAGILPPFSGEHENALWKHSNGGWIRSEIWACLSPGFPHIANHYAYMDACVDHGSGEGTYGEIFTATMESLAFFETDIREIIEKALTFIPQESRLAKSVRLVLTAYDRGEEWVQVRNRLVEQSADLGWFQAPANIGFVVLGLLYGEGDFRRSVLYAVNCGDDTDCTGATAGAFLGILKGMEGIPADWAEYIGEEIRTVALTAECYDLPGNCMDLTRRVMSMIPVVWKANGINMEYTQGDSDLTHTRELAVSEGISWAMYDRGEDTVTSRLGMKPCSYLAFDTVYARGIAEFEGEPRLKEGSLRFRLRLYNKMMEPRYLYFHAYLPRGWSAEYAKSIFMRYPNVHDETDRQRYEIWEITVRADEGAQTQNRMVIEVTADGRCLTGLVPVCILN